MPEAPTHSRITTRTRQNRDDANILKTTTLTEENEKRGADDGLRNGDEDGAKLREDSQHYHKDG